jgi:hypothetical protein
MRLIFSLLFTAALACVPAMAQRQCSDARYVIAPMSDTTSQVRASSGNPAIVGYEIQIKIAYPTPNGPVTKREMRYVPAGSAADFNVPAEQITDVTILCYKTGQR